MRTRKKEQTRKWICVVVVLVMLMVSCDTGMTGQEEISEQDQREMVQQVQEFTDAQLIKLCDQGYTFACDWLEIRRSR